MIPSGADLIRAERRRQIDGEGYTPAHDAELLPGDLIAAAWCYLGDLTVNGDDFTEAEHFEVPEGWPWEAGAWKPTPDDDVRQLVKAGALIAAEIDRRLADRPDALEASLAAARQSLGDKESEGPRPSDRPAGADDVAVPSPAAPSAGGES